MVAGYPPSTYLGQYSPGTAPALSPVERLPQETGALGVEVWSVDGATRLGFIRDVISATRTTRVNQVGELTFIVSAAEDPPMDAAAAPPTLSGLQLWLDADRNVYSDAGVTPAVNGGNVQQWNDLSGNGNHVSAGATLPVYRTNRLNGHAAIENTSPANGLATAALSLAQPFTVVMVHRIVDPVALDRMLWGSNAGAMDVRMRPTTADLRLFGSANGPEQAYVQNAYGVLITTVDGASSSHVLNGGTAVTGNPGTGTINGLGLSARSDGSFPTSADLLEVAVYNRALTADERALLQGYFNQKFALGSSGRRMAASTLASLLTSGREVRLIREGTGEVGRGVIESVRTETGETPLISVRAASRAIELVWANTYLGVQARDEAPATVAATLLAGLSPTWSVLDSVTSPVNLRTTYVNQTLWRALNLLAETQNGYIRETATDRQLEIKNSTTASGLRLMNVESLGPDRESNTLVGLVRSIRMEEDGSGIINRISPQGQRQGDILLDLSQSNRSSPYTRQSRLSGRIHATYASPTTFGVGATTVTNSPIRVGGQNTIVLVMNGIANAGASHTSSFNNQTLWNAYVSNGTNYSITVAYLVNPDPTNDGIAKVIYDVATTAGGVMIVIVLENVRQATPITSTTAHAAEGTSTTPSVTVPSAFLRDGGLLLDFMMRAGAPTTTPGAGQTILTNIGEAYVSAEDIPDPVAGNLTMDWTLSGAQNWRSLALAFAPQYAWYIEDSASVTAYGRRTLMLPLNSQRLNGVSNAEIQAAANTIYDIAATRLQRLKDPVTHYEVEIVSLPTGTSWLVGDSMRLIYRGLVQSMGSNSFVWKDINTDLIAMEATASYEPSRATSWRIRFASVYQHPQSALNVIGGQSRALDDLAI